MIAYFTRGALAVVAAVCLLACAQDEVSSGCDVTAEQTNGDNADSAAKVSAQCNVDVKQDDRTGEGGAGGGGGAPLKTCSADAECTSDYPCETGACNNGGCEWTPLPAGTVPPQPAGDCRLWLCTPFWSEKVSDADSDDGDDCTVDACSNGSASHLPTPTGSPCTVGASCSNGACL